MSGGNGGVGFKHPTHVVLFPFMSKGHTIPILHLAHLLLRRAVAVTIITTPANRPFIASFLDDTHLDSIVVLPFPQNIDGLPPGVESTDKLPSISLFYEFATATKRMQGHFETLLSSLPGGVSFIVSDAFLPWTLQSSSKFGIPRFVCDGMSSRVMAIFREIFRNGLKTESIESGDELISVPNLPSVKVSLKDFDQNVVYPDIYGTQLGFEFTKEMFSANSRSHGVIVNSFYELEPFYFDHWERHSGQKAWGLGPFCLGEPLKEISDIAKSPWMKWLDQKLEKGEFVLYVAFGSQTEISGEQFEQIRIGLERSELNFLWVVRGHEDKQGDGFENRGMVVREWVDQRAILEHQSVTGFLSHCGWNSVMESICAKVPIVAWPMMADQYLNARFVTEEVGIGIRVETSDGSVRSFVEWKGLERTVRELMQGERGKEARKRVLELSDAARRAVADGGSSCQALTELINRSLDTLGTK